MATSQELDAEIADLERKLADARKAAEALRVQEKADMIAQIDALIIQYGITANELTFPGATKGRKVRVGKPGKGTVGQAKYKDPSSGKTWTGHGKPPGWIPADKEARKQYLIEQ
ncbi:H-NS histone family protein [Burkholderia gladioli]|uniref:H-NS histone family protein n=1 Tax=Burkholderia gladioli TaxID=28095 RepID=UPI0016419F6F|nr:H-NS histone family protein [Burkholderia gladioli]